jgi:hypothetical protein
MKISKDCNLTNTRGITLLETAIAIPVLVTVVLGLLDISNYYRSKAAIQQASEETLRCLASLEDCASLPAPNGEPLYEIRATSGSTTTSLPLVRLGGTVTGLTPQRINATSFRAEYLSSVHATGIGRTILENTYTPEINASYLVRSPNTNVGLRANGTYDVTGEIKNLSFSESTINPTNRNLTINFVTPKKLPYDSNVTNRCVVGSLETFERCTSTERENLSNFFMILLEGTAQNGISGNISEITLALQNQLTGEVTQLGGQQFQDPGLGHSAPEPFLPRGGKLYVATTPQLLPSGSEFSTYRHLPLNYDTPYRLTMNLTRASSAAWELTGAKLVLPTYKRQEFKETCPQDLSGASIDALSMPNNQHCPLQEESSKKIEFLSVKGTSPVHATRGQSGEKQEAGHLDCNAPIPNNPELSISPPECRNLEETVPCKVTTVIPGIPNYGVPETSDEQGRVTASSTAANVCDAPLSAGFTPLWWNVATATINSSDLASSDRISVERTDCLHEPADTDLIPAKLRNFHHITITGREVSSRAENSRDFVKFQSGKSFSPQYECFKPRTVTISEYLFDDAPFGYPGEYDCATAIQKQGQLSAQATEILTFNISTVRSKNRYNVGPKAAVPQCYKPHDLITELVGELRETPLPISPLTLKNAKAYCASQGISCTYNLVSYTAKNTNELYTFQLAKAQQKGENLLKAVASKHGLINGKITPGATINAEGQEVVSVAASAEIPSLLKGLVPGGGTTVVRYFSSRVSERGLLH